jgi:hypothetical protein
VRIVFLSLGILTKARLGACSRAATRRLKDWSQGCRPSERDLERRQPRVCSLPLRLGGHRADMGWFCYILLSWMHTRYTIAARVVSSGGRPACWRNGRPTRCYCLKCHGELSSDKRRADLITSIMARIAAQCWVSLPRPREGGGAVGKEWVARTRQRDASPRRPTTPTIAQTQHSRQ